MLGALPDSLIIVVSGIGVSREVAQEQVRQPCWMGLQDYFKLVCHIAKQMLAIPSSGLAAYHMLSVA